MLSDKEKLDYLISFLITLKGCLMSRTIRKIPDNHYFSNWWEGTTLWTPKFHNPKEVGRAKARSTADHISGMYNLPKSFRKVVNHARRAVDRAEISKIMKNVEYVPNMSPWGCRDSQSWNWW